MSRSHRSAGWKWSVVCLTVHWFWKPADAAQTINRDWSAPESAPLVFPDGHSVRVERPVPENNPPPDGRNRVILKQPDGHEILVWNPPAWKPDLRPSSGDVPQKMVALSSPYTAAIDDKQLGIVFSESDFFTTWWIRWDRKAQSLLPIITTNGIGSNATLTLMEPSVLHVKGGVGNFRLIPKPDGQLQEFKGRIAPEFRLWPKYHSAFDGDVVMVFSGELNGWEIWKEKNAPGWPLVSLPDPKAPSPERVLISSGQGTPGSGPVEKAANEPATDKFRGVWLWLGGVIVLALAAWFVVRRRLRRPPNSPRSEKHRH